MTDTADIERRLNVLEQQMTALQEQLREKERGARQGLLQFVAAIEEFRGDEPRTADLRKAEKARRAGVDRTGKM